MSKWTYFSDDEVQGLVPELVAMLDQARHTANTPFILTSTVRSIQDNEHVLGVEHSSHLIGKAVDIRVTDSHTRFLILKGLLSAGFTRLGVYDRHIHADIDETKPVEDCWTGVSH